MGIPKQLDHAESIHVLCRGGECAIVCVCVYEGARICYDVCHTRDHRRFHLCARVCDCNCVLLNMMAGTRAIAVVVLVCYNTLYVGKRGVQSSFDSEYAMRALV